MWEVYQHLLTNDLRIDHAMINSRTVYQGDTGSIYWHSPEIMVMVMKAVMGQHLRFLMIRSRGCPGKRVMGESPIAHRTPLASWNSYCPVTVGSFTPRSRCELCFLTPLLKDWVLAFSVMCLQTSAVNFF